MCKKILSIAIIFCGSLFFCRNDLMAFAIQDSNLAYAQIVSLNQIRAVGLQTVGTVVIWNQAGDPADIHNDDGWPVWLECDGSSFDTGYYTTLASIIPGGVLPNLKDQFLRGGTSGQVGQMAHGSKLLKDSLCSLFDEPFFGHLPSPKLNPTRDCCDVIKLIFCFTCFFGNMCVGVPLVHGPRVCFPTLLVFNF